MQHALLACDNEEIYLLRLITYTTNLQGAATYR